MLVNVMRAVVMRRYGDPSLMRLETTVPVPTLESGAKGGDKSMRVRVLAAGVDPGVWHVATGKPFVARLAFGLLETKTPIPGTDLSLIHI